MSGERERERAVEERLRPRRECPVPRPGGLVGLVLGWKGEEEEPVRVEGRRVRSRAEKRDGER